jgi:membrane protease YdiL (CAAX protease family)
VLALRLAHSLLSPWIPAGARELSFVLVMLGGLLIGHVWTFRLVDPRGWSFVGLGQAAFQPASIGQGAALGAATIALPVGILLALDWMEVVPSDPGSSLGAALATLAILVPAALWEELFVRGYAYAVVRERWGAVPAITTTSLLFGTMHYLNQGASIQAVLVVCLAGFFLGGIREKTGSLYATWAAHLAWNVVLVVAFHATVSGLTMASPDYRLIDVGPDWATGGAWGPEGGYFAAAGLALATWYVIRRPLRRRSEGDARA